MESNTNQTKKGNSMNNEIVINIEWDMNANGMSFTTAFGTVRKCWEEILCQAFDINLYSDKGAAVCGSFAIKEYNEENMSVVINAKHLGTVEIGPSANGGKNGRVRIWKQKRRNGDFNELVATISFGNIIQAI